MRVVDAGADARWSTSRARGRPRAARARSPTRTSFAASAAEGGSGSSFSSFSPLGAPSREVFVELGEPSRPSTSTSSKNRRSIDASSAASNRYTWNGFSKSAGRFGVITKTRPAAVQTRASSATCRSGRLEVLDDVRRAHPVDGVVADAERGAVHRREAQAGRHRACVRRRRRSRRCSRRRGRCVPGAVSSAVSDARRRSRRRGRRPCRAGSASRGSRRRGTRAASRGSRPPSGAHR